MLEFKRSIDIALSEHPAEGDPREMVVVPITADEALVASRGLGTHLDILYKAVLKKSDSDRALLAVYDFISDKVDGFRRRSYNLSVVLDPERAQPSESRALAAAAISYLYNGSSSHRTGVWLRGKAREEQLMDTFHEVMTYNDTTYSNISKWGRKQSIRNTIHWRWQLEKIRSSEYVAQLREAIDESDRYLEV